MEILKIERREFVEGDIVHIVRIVSLFNVKLYTFYFTTSSRSAYEDLFPRKKDFEVKGFKNEEN